MNTETEKKPASAQSDLIEVLGMLCENGYQAVFGADAVMEAITASSDGSTKKLYSGYRVFPGGDKCSGCADCIPNV